MGFLEGALRMMPAWEINFVGHTLSLSVLIPAVVIPGLLFTCMFVWPFFEQWATGDKSQHHINDRPRNAPVRTAIGVAVIVFYGVLWAEGANDVLADQLHVPLYEITRAAQVLVILGPIVAYIVTKRVCLRLQHHDNLLLSHGMETGIIRQLPNGEFIEVTRPVSESARAVIESKKALPQLPGGPSKAAVSEGNEVPPPASRGLMGKAKARVNRAFTETIPLEPSGNGHGNGHHEPAAVGTGSQEHGLPPGEDSASH